MLFRYCEKYNGIWSGDLGIGGKRSIEENNVRLYKMGIQIGLLSTLRYLMMKELGIEKLMIRWGLRARNFELKIKDIEESKWVKKYWKEKEERG